MKKSPCFKAWLLAVAALTTVPSARAETISRDSFGSLYLNTGTTHYDLTSTKGDLTKIGFSVLLPLFRSVPVGSWWLDNLKISLSTGYDYMFGRIGHRYAHASDSSATSHLCENIPNISLDICITSGVSVLDLDAVGTKSRLGGLKSGVAFEYFVSDVFTTRLAYDSTSYSRSDNQGLDAQAFTLAFGMRFPVRYLGN